MHEPSGYLVTLDIDAEGRSAFNADMVDVLHPPAMRAELPVVGDPDEDDNHASFINQQTREMTRFWETLVDRGFALTPSTNWSADALHRIVAQLAAAFPTLQMRLACDGNASGEEIIRSWRVYRNGQMSTGENQVLRWVKADCTAKPPRARASSC